MISPNPAMSLEDQIGLWRSFLRRRQVIRPVDVAELEDHLRDQIAHLVEGGLAEDEAFLVAVKRMGSLDALSREFAREHSDRLWKQLVLVPSETEEVPGRTRTDAVIAVAFALVAALLTRVPNLFGVDFVQDENHYFRNVSFFVFPVLAGYFAWKRGLALRTLAWLALAFVIGLVFANVYPFTPGGSTEALTALHLPIALWLFVGIAYAGGRWGTVEGRMDFIRFSGEMFIYGVLIALGGSVFTAFMVQIFSTIGIDVAPYLPYWMVAGVAGGAVIAAWLVEAKQSVIENMAPVLTRVFSPLFALLLVAFLATLAFTGRGIDIQRDVLIAFDLLLAVIVGLLLYAISARDPRSPPSAFDAVLIVLVISALLVDVVALWAIAARITEFGFTPNRVAALGENVLLLIHLGVSAVLYLRFARGRGTFASLEKWQTDYLPVYPVWAAAVVVLFPPIFGYI